MSKFADIEGVGRLEFPDDATDEAMDIAVRREVDTYNQAARKSGAQAKVRQQQMDAIGMAPPPQQPQPPQAPPATQPPSIDPSVVEAIGTLTGKETLDDVAKQVKRRWSPVSALFPVPGEPTQTFRETAGEHLREAAAPLGIAGAAAGAPAGMLGGVLGSLIPELGTQAVEGEFDPLQAGLAAAPIPAAKAGRGAAVRLIPGSRPGRAKALKETAAPLFEEVKRRTKEIAGETVDIIPESVKEISSTITREAERIAGMAPELATADSKKLAKIAERLSRRIGMTYDEARAVLERVGRRVHRLKRQGGEELGEAKLLYGAINKDIEKALLEQAPHGVAKAYKQAQSLTRKAIKLEREPGLSESIGRVGARAGVGGAIGGAVIGGPLGFAVGAITPELIAQVAKSKPGQAAIARLAKQGKGAGAGLTTLMQLLRMKAEED